MFHFKNEETDRIVHTSSAPRFPELRRLAQILGLGLDQSDNLNDSPDSDNSNISDSFDGADDFGNPVKF